MKLRDSITDKLDIRPGEVVALLGRNGMGKSTTIKALVGGLRPQRGEIRFVLIDGPVAVVV